MASSAPWVIEAGNEAGLLAVREAIGHGQPPSAFSHGLGDRLAAIGGARS